MIRKNQQTENIKHIFTILIVLSFPIISFYWHHSYPFWALESVIIFAGMFLLSALTMLLLKKSNEKLANGLLAAMISLVWVVQFDLFLTGLVVSVLVLSVLATLLSGKIFRLFTSAVFLALIAGAYLDNRISFENNRKVLTNPKQNQNLPPIVHLILDSFIGPEGLPPQDPAQEFKSEIMDFLHNNQFNAYTQAYSHYAATQDSLTNAFNFETDPRDIFHENDALHNKYVLESNRYLEMLYEQGYSIQIFQSEFMDFCHSLASPVNRCWTYNIPKVSTIHNGVPSVVERAGLLIQQIIIQSKIIKSYAIRMRWYEGNGITLYDQEVLSAIEEDLKTRAYGTVYFAHLLLPHGPFVMRKDCSLNYETDQWLRDAHTLGYVVNSPESRGMRYFHYLEQSKCTLKVLNDFFDAMRLQGIYDDSIVIIHGDHGSAIYEYSISAMLDSLLTASDFRDAFSILFAVKFPQGSFQINKETSSLEMLLSKVSRTLSTQPIPELSNQPFIYMFDGPTLYRKDIDIFASP